VKKTLIAGLFLLLVATTLTSFTLRNQLRQAKKEIKTIVVNPDLLQRKLNAPIPAWMQQQVKKDLANFPYGITRSMLDQSFLGNRIHQYSLVRFSITDGHISFSHDERTLHSRHFQELLSCIQTLNKLVKLPNVDFMVSLEDGFSEDLDLGPCFVFAKTKDLKSQILIPDINALAGYTKLRKLIPVGNHKYQWESKLEQAFWRGSSTGGTLTPTTWDSFPRCKLALLSLAHPKDLNAKVTKVVQCENETKTLIHSKGLVAATVDRIDHLKYKYLVDVDGNSCSFERYFWLLLSNSLVIKQVTPYIQWYYGALEPYKHFLPVKEDLSDLMEKIQWARTHDAEAKAMAQNATKFAQENLTAEDTLVYLKHLLDEYAKIQIL